MRFLLFFVVFSMLLARCAKPCPSDVNLGALNLTPASRAFLPAAQQVETMTFVNTDGAKMNFQNQSGSIGNKPFQLNVETMCQRGDFLDKTAQTAYYNADAYHLYYRSTDQNYTLSIDLMLENAGEYGSRSDTAFYETLGIAGQKLSAPTRVGSLRILSSERGNEAKIGNMIRQNNNEFRIVADTTILGRPLQNLWVAADNGNHPFVIFYSKIRGIEAFTTPEGAWVRE
jgi:hypothetical protein